MGDVVVKRMKHGEEEIQVYNALTANKLGSESKGGALKPVYFVSGEPKEGTQMYETSLTVNSTTYKKFLRTESSSSGVAFYAPTSAGQKGKFLVSTYESSSSSGEPSWTDISFTTLKTHPTTLSGYGITDGVSTSGAEMEGKLVAQTTTDTARQVRNIIIGTATPDSTVGENGDIYFKYDSS